MTEAKSREIEAVAFAFRHVPVAGFRILHSLAWGRFCYVDDLVTDEQSRSEGLGAELMDWLLAFARERLSARAEVREDLHPDDVFWCTADPGWVTGTSYGIIAPLTNVGEFIPRVLRDYLGAFCVWDGGRLPTDAEWEKVARGPDGFDYALGMTISDDEVSLYNWRKNPGASVTVVGIQSTRDSYMPNRYGIYHLTGNVAEWSQSVNVPYNRDHPYLEDERNHDETPGLRSARGGSWYSAAISYLYIPYRDAFQPEHCNQELGFRIVAKALP